MAIETALYLALAALCIGLAIRWVCRCSKEFNDTMRSFNNYGE
jgi:hypothetical protein